MFWGGGNFSCRHPKLWEYIKSNVKAFFITGAIVFTISASATTVRILHSRQVRYKNDKSVEQAINELYRKGIESGKIIEGCLGCTKLEYLESTGTQYIDTEYIPKINTKLVLDLKFSGDFKNGYNVTNIYHSGNNNSVFGLNFGEGKSQSNQLYAWIDKSYGGGGSIYNFIITDTIKYNRNTITMQSGSITYGDVMRAIATKTTNNDVNLVLFGGYDSTGNIVSFSAYNMYVYTLELYEGDTLVRDYIPVLDKDKRPCLFDEVSKTCFYNQGTGEFLYG